MKSVRALCWLSILLTFGGSMRAGDNGFRGRLPSGPFTPGFRLMEVPDASRSFPGEPAGVVISRPLRIYMWYPANGSAQPRLRLDDYVRMAVGDFSPAALPVPLAKGFEAGRREALLSAPTEAVRDAEAAPGKFPLLILGQGLFYESPLSHFVLCEFLASHGYVVATSPLLGTQYRLVNLNVADLETEVRDMEFVLAQARSLPFTDPGRLGVIGYDMGGMAGLILSMRNPDVDGFLSMDSGILDPHHSGLPGSHPQYREDRFRIPWMHMTQARFIRSENERSAAPSLFERKTFGPSYLVHVPTTSHGGFSSYAAMGVSRAVPGYWGASDADPGPLYDDICRMSLAFFDACLKQDGMPLQKAFEAGRDAAAGSPAFRIERKEGQAPPPSEAGIIQLIIDKGLPQAGPVIAGIRAGYPGLDLVDETVLNWLGLHFFFWWGREEEAVGVFELNAALHPGSWKAHDGLGEIYADRGRTAEAIQSYQKSLALNPDNSGARAALEKLSPSGTAATAPAPAEIQSGMIDVEGGKLFYEMAGKGETIILIHDGLLHREVWDAQFAAFAADHRVVRYDRRGYGRSLRPEHPFSNVEDLRRLFEQLGIDQATLMGMSSGGGLAIDFTLKYPRKVGMLVLVGAVVSGLGYTDHFLTRGGHLTSADAQTPEAVLEYWAVKDPYEIAPANKAAKEKAKRLLLENPQDLDDANGSFAQGPERPALPNLREISIPVLIVAGEEDIPDVHAHAGAILAGIPGATRIVIPGAGHLVPMEKPSEFNLQVFLFMKEARRPAGPPTR